MPLFDRGDQLGERGGGQRRRDLVTHAARIDDGRRGGRDPREPSTTLCSSTLPSGGAPQGSRHGSTGLAARQRAI
jgi:hypothetical protein